LKFSRESDIRLSAGLAHKRMPNVPPCNFAVVPPDFPQRVAAALTAFNKIGFPSGYSRPP